MISATQNIMSLVRLINAKNIFKTIQDKLVWIIKDFENDIIEVLEDPYNKITQYDFKQLEKIDTDFLLDIKKLKDDLKKIIIFQKKPMVVEKDVIPESINEYIDTVIQHTIFMKNTFKNHRIKMSITNPAISLFLDSWSYRFSSVLFMEIEAITV